MGFGEGFVFQNYAGDDWQNGTTLKAAEKELIHTLKLISKEAPNLRCHIPKFFPGPTTSVWRLEIGRDRNDYLNWKTEVLWHSFIRLRSGAWRPGRWNIERFLPSAER